MKRHNPLRARIALIAHRARHQDVHEASARRDTFLALLVLALVMFGAPLADWAYPPDWDAGTDPATPQAELWWLHDAPDLWAVEQIDLPPADPPSTWKDYPPQPGRTDVWKKIPAGGERWPTATD